MFGSCGGRHLGGAGFPTGVCFGTGGMILVRLDVFWLGLAVFLEDLDFLSLHLTLSGQSQKLYLGLNIRPDAQSNLNAVPSVHI
jgi:hypothetical protein